MRRAGFVALALALSGGCSRDDLPVCDACIVALDRGVRLESDELAIGSRVTRLGNGRFLAVGGYAPERILEFDSTGRLLRAVGKAGGGPGEFRRLAFVVASDSSIYAIEGNRLHELDDGLAWIRTVELPVSSADAVVLSDGSVVGHPAGFGRSASPLLFRIDPDSPADVRWFDPSADDGRDARYRLLTYGEGEILSIGLLEPGVRVFDEAGTQLRALRVRHPWFDRGDRDGRVRVFDLVRDGDRLLLLVARQPPLPARPAAGDGEEAPRALSPGEFTDLWEQQLVAVRAADGAIVATQPVEGVSLLGFADAGHVYGFPRGDMVDMHVWRVATASALP